MNGRERAERYPEVVEKQHGEFCNGCGKNVFHNPYSKLPKWTCVILYIDHIDNDKTHNDIENYQLLCPTCNRIKNPKRSEVISERPKGPEMQRGDIQEAEYRTWVREQIIKHDWITDDDCIDAGAEYLTNFTDGKTISPVTTRRYLGKMTSTAGEYAVEKGWVTFAWKLPNLVDWLNKIKRDKDLKIEKMNEIRESFKEA